MCSSFDVKLQSFSIYDGVIRIINVAGRVNANAFDVFREKCHWKICINYISNSSYRETCIYFQLHDRSKYYLSVRHI